MHKSKWSQVVYEKNLSENFRATSLDSLANSSNQSESLSDESHDSDSGADTKSKNSFTVKCEVYSQNPCGSVRSWTRSESGSSDRTYDYVEEKKPSDKRLDSALARMETIPEENEPKVSVKAILARFENLKGDKDCNNNYSHVNKGGKVVKDVSGGAASASACSSASSKSSSSSSSSNKSNPSRDKEEKKTKKEPKAVKEVTK